MALWSQRRIIIQLVDDNLTVLHNKYDPSDAEGRVQQQVGQVSPGATALALKQAVRDVARPDEVQQQIVDHLLEELRSDDVVSLGHWL